MKKSVDREKLKANVLKFIRIIKERIYENTHGIYTGEDIVIKFNRFEKEIKLKRKHLQNEIN